MENLVLYSSLTLFTLENHLRYREVTKSDSFRAVEGTMRHEFTVKLMH